MENKFTKNFSSCKERTFDGHRTDMSSFARIAAMLLMLMTLSVGQVWADGYSLAGTIPGCGWDDTKKFTGSGPYTATVTLTAGQTGPYEFKVKPQGSSWDGSYGKSTIDFSRSNNSGALSPSGGNVKFTPDGAGDYIFTFNSGTLTITYPAAAPPTYYIKHNWNGAGSWEWKGPMTDNGDGTYYYVGGYGASGCNWNTTGADSGSRWIASPAVEGAPAKGDECTFTLNPSANTITITKNATCTANAVNWTATPANGFMGGSMTIGATATGGSVTYESSNTSVATIEGTTLKYIAPGTATITAKVEGDGTYCDANATQEITVTAAPTDCRLYYSNPNSWGAVYAYVWKGGGAQKTAWPGDKITDAYETINGVKYYYIDVDDDSYDNLIFNNGNGTQTGDLTVSGNCDKYCDGTSWKPLPTPEVKYAVTINNGDHGTVEPNGEKQVGSTGITITATPAAGYNFQRWEVTGGAQVADASAATTTLTATATGSVTATYVEGITSSWYISGVASPFGGWGTSGIQMTKVSENVYSAEVVAPSATPGTDDYQFKIYNGSTGEYWAANGYWVTRENYHPTLEQNDKHANMRFKPDMLGTYTFTLDCTGASPVLTVTYPCKPSGWTIDFDNGDVTDMPLVEQSDGTYKLTFYITNDNAEFRVSDGCETYTLNAGSPEYLPNFDGTLVESNKIMKYTGSLYRFVTATIDGNHFTMGEASPEDLNLALSAEIENPVREAGSSDIHFQNIVAKVPAGVSGVKIAVYELNSDNASGTKKQTFRTDLDVTATEYTTTAQTFETGHTYYYCLALYQEGNPKVYSQVLTITIPAYTITYGPCTSGNGSVSGTVDSGSTVNIGDVVTLTATPDPGYYLKGWYGVESGDDQRLAYATMADNYQYQVTVDGDEFVYAKFEAIPQNVKIAGNFYTGQSDWTCIDADNYSAGVYTWAFEAHANSNKEFVFKASTCPYDAMIKYTNKDVTYASTGCTLGKASANDNYGITNEEKILTFTLTYGSGVHVQVDAVDIPIKIVSIETSPATPQEGNVVTVTPTVSGPVGATVYYCWTLKNGGVDTGVTFTDKHDGTFSFTAPAAGSYTIHLEVKPSDDCAGEAYDTKDQDFRVYGDNFIIYAGTEAGWKDWQGIKAITSSSESGKEGKVKLDREDIGEDSYGRHWFMFTLPISDTNGYLVFYNAVDEWPAEADGYGSARTATLVKPTEDACYVVLSEKGAYENRKVRTDICPAEPVVTITSPAHVIKDGTYAITTKTIMIPGEISYTYTVTDPTSAAVSVSEDGKFTASKVGTYHVQVTATGSAGISATSDVLDVVCEAASITASVSPTTTSSGATVELTATPTGFSTPAYQWYVKKPGSATYVEMDGYTEVSGKYVPNQTGSYVFQVKATENGVTKQATCTLTVSTQNYYLKHDSSTGWVCKPMTYNTSEGNYWVKAIYYGAGINIHTECINGYGMPYYRFVEEADNFTFEGGKDTYSAGDEVFYFFNPMTTHITVQKANTNSYRIVSTSTKGEFYSNTVVLADDVEQKEVSFFFAQDNGSLKLQKFGESGWVDQSLSLSTSAFTSDNVYKAKLDLTNGLTSVKVYSGYYYIFSELGSLTECTNDNKMTAFNNINEEEYYNHYWCKWTEAKKNTSATVGNEINHNLANALSSDKQSKMSVRYAYKPENNHFSRAYLRGSQDDKTNFLKVFGENIKAENGTPLNSLANSQVFSDGSDWVYTTYVKAAAEAYIKLAAHMQGDEYNYLLSASGSKDAKRNIYGVEGDFADELRFAIIYDFKTNRVISAWSPTGEEEFDHPVTIDADLLVVRKAVNNSGITIFTLTGEGQVKLIRKIYTAIELDRDSLFEEGGALKHGLRSRMFQVCVPYDLNIRDITGFVEYGTKVHLQAYGGELRAALGWQSYITTFWGNMAYAKSSNIIANRGYVIMHNYSRSDFHEITLEGGEKISKMTIYFPSPTKDDGYVIGPVNRYAPTNFHKDNLQCSVSGREKIDSNWQMIGIPGYYPATVQSADPEETETGKNDPETNIVTPVTTLHWLYDWNGEYGSYTAYKATEFNLQPTQAYMVQYGGTVTWGAPLAETGDGQTDPIPYPDFVAARAYAPEESASLNGEYCLQLMDNNDKFLDQTFVVLSATATEDYEPNLDLTKALTDGAPQLFTTAGGYSLAANTLQNSITEIPVCTSLGNAGDYTFHLKKMTSGSQVPYLYDAQTNTYTNLSTDDYYFSGVAGKEQGRFYIVFGYKAPEIATSVENVALDGKNGESIEKLMINGILYILRDGKLYDAMGKTVK